MSSASPHPLSPARISSEHASACSRAVSTRPAARDVYMLALLCIKAEAEAENKNTQTEERERDENIKFKWIIFAQCNKYFSSGWERKRVWESSDFFLQLEQWFATFTRMGWCNRKLGKRGKWWVKAKHRNLSYPLWWFHDKVRVGGSVDVSGWYPGRL